jgi:hypothetical protein
MIRAFLTTWSDANLVGGKGTLINPIVDLLDSYNRGDIKIKTYWPRRTMAGGGIPEHQAILVIVKTDTSMDYTEIEALPNTYMLPNYKPSKLISDIPVSVRTAALNAMDSLNIPKAIFSGAATWGDILRTIRSYLKPGSSIDPHIDAALEVYSG